MTAADDEEYKKLLNSMELPQVVLQFEENSEEKEDKESDIRAKEDDGPRRNLLSIMQDIKTYLNTTSKAPNYKASGEACLEDSKNWYDTIEIIKKEECFDQRSMVGVGRVCKTLLASEHAPRMCWFSDFAINSIDIILKLWNNEHGGYIGDFSKGFWKSVQILGGKCFAQNLFSLLDTH